MTARRTASALALFLSLVSSAAAADPPEDPGLSDACLHAVRFVDERQGWAVGDRGVIWHSDNGGTSWERQTSGTVCALHALCFAGDKTGWIVGGQGLPYSPASSGLVLATRDGGLRWEPVSWQQFPRLLGVQFVNGKSGWAWGESSEFFPTGLFASETAGQKWVPAAGPPARGWMAGLFPSAEQGVLGGPAGASALVSQRALRGVKPGALGAVGVRAMTASDDGTCWAVGDGGTVLRSDTQGASWALSGGPFSTAHRLLFDWRGVHARGPSVWVVGRPGSVVLYSPDSGASWQPRFTGQNLPLESIWFQDARRGWAVGALGTILATEDGGASWRVQRGGGERAAVLAVHGDALSAPLLTHARLANDQGYLAVDLAMVRPPDGAAGLESEVALQRLADAVLVAGGTAAELDWRFPADPVALSLPQVLAAWNRRAEGRALGDLEARLALAIRVWRPDVIVADSPDPSRTSDPAGALVCQALEQALASAADPAAFPELVDAARLAPWSAGKLFWRTRERSAGDVEIDGRELSPVTGRPLADLVGLATALLADSYRDAETLVRYRPAASRLAGEKPDNTLMAGLRLEPGGPARRRLISPVEISDGDRRGEQMRRNLLAVLEQAEQQPVLAEQLHARLDLTLQQLSGDQAGNVLFAFARAQFRRGHWAESRELLEKLAREYPHHLAAVEAHRWLVQFYASSEARHRERLSGAVSQAVFVPTGEGAAKGGEHKAAAPETVPRGTPGVDASRQGAAAGGLASGIPWASGSVDAARRLAQIAPLAWSDPAVQFPVAAAQRQLGNVKDADQFVTAFALGRETGPWGQAARGEHWLRDQKGDPGKPIIVARRSAPPPHLDGRLDEPFWKGTTPAPLADLGENREPGWETELRLAHDGRFLYIAASCASPSGEPAQPLRPRARDADLSAHDRIEFYFDLDRDYATYYHLAVDERGSVCEDCWGDATWNPTWYVASHNDERGYTIEAAIPLDELADGSPAPGTVWAFNAVRVVPGQRIMAWSRPAGVRPRPEGFGLLLFGDAPAPPRRAPLAN